ncbi:lmo0937 family membrane protein [Rheinheimera faecalis]
MGSFIHLWSTPMLETIVAILVILWLLGMVSSYSLGGALHLLLVVALVIIVLRVLQRRRL